LSPEEPAALELPEPLATLLDDPFLVSELADEESPDPLEALDPFDPAGEESLPAATVLDPLRLSLR